LLPIALTHQNYIYLYGEELRKLSEPKTLDSHYHTCYNTNEASNRSFTLQQDILSLTPQRHLKTSVSNVPTERIPTEEPLHPRSLLSQPEERRTLLSLRSAILLENERREAIYCVSGQRDNLDLMFCKRHRSQLSQLEDHHKHYITPVPIVPYIPF